MSRIILVNEVSSFNIVRGYPNKYHKYHILSPSIWPFVAALGIMLMVFGFVFWFYTGFILTLLFGLVELILIVFFWWQDVSYESGEHTSEIMSGLKFGMALFIVSEVMFFFSFFWAFFQVSLVPGHEVGGVWPPVGLEELVIDPWSVPLLNTFLLLSSGVTVTCAHHAFLFFFSVERASSGISFESFKITVNSLQEFFVRIILLKKNGIEKLYVGIELLILTIILALIFTLLQCYEYVESLIRISDSVYGSTFFVMTGFHGFHVIIGSTFLIVCLIRIILNQFYIKDSVGLECSIWYWHFVDVVWLFLFVSLYMWGNDASIMVDWVQFEDNQRGGAHEVKGLYSSETCDINTNNSDVERDGVYNTGGYLNSDFASPYQLGFQDSASLLMDGIVELHNKIMVYLFFIFLVVMWILVACLKDVADNRLQEYSWVLENVVYPLLQSSKVEYKKVASIFVVVLNKIKTINFKRILKK